MYCTCKVDDFPASFFLSHSHSLFFWSCSPVSFMFLWLYCVIRCFKVSVLPLLLVLTSAVVVQGPPGLPGLKGDPGSKGEKVGVAFFPCV